MNGFKSLLSYLRREPWTIVMLAAVLAALVWQATQHAPPAPEKPAVSAPAASAPAVPAPTPPSDPHSEAERLQTTRKMEALEAKILQDPKLRAVVGMVVLLVFGLAALGAVWGILLLQSVRRGERWMEQFGSPRITWGIGEAFRAVVLMFFLDLILSAGLSYLFSLSGAGQVNWSLMSAVLVRSLLMIVYLSWMVRRHNGGWADLGLCSRRPFRQVLWGLAGYLAMIPVYMLVLAALLVILKLLQIDAPVQTPVQILYTEANALAVLAYLFFMGILGPWFEEILFRGYVYPVFRARLGVWPGIMVSSILFAALHGHGIAFVPILVLGIALHLLYERSGSVIPGAVLHMTHNSAMLALTLAIRQMTAAVS